MQFKKGYGWKACYDEKSGRYFGEYGGIQEYNLYELTKEQYDALDKKMKESDAGTIMHEGRRLYMAVDDRCGPPYTIVFDDDYEKLCPWADIVKNGTAVPMPYRLGGLKAAGIPGDESRKEIELAPGNFFTANLFLEENEDYLISPAYHNGENDTINISDAKAEQITMITYSGEPVDQGVSLFGVTFGMTKSDVKAMLGEPMSDNGDYFEWQINVSDAGYKGSFSIYFTDNADDAGASQIDLSLIEK